MIHALEAILIGYVVFAVFGVPLRDVRRAERHQGKPIRVAAADHRRPTSRARR